jgi:hypothetical protein
MPSIIAALRTLATERCSIGHDHHQQQQSSQDVLYSKCAQTGIVELGAAAEGNGKLMSQAGRKLLYNLVNTPVSLVVYTFGAPRIGNQVHFCIAFSIPLLRSLIFLRHPHLSNWPSQALANRMNRRLSSHFRVELDGDIVCEMPLGILGIGYHHVGTQVRIINTAFHF